MVAASNSRTRAGPEQVIYGVVGAVYSQQRTRTKSFSDTNPSANETPMSQIASPFLAISLTLCLLSCPDARAEDNVVSLGRGRVKLTAPEKWVVKTPKSRIVEREFAAPGGDESDPARVTMMGAGGSVDANIQRWEGQFASADGGAVKAKTDVLKVAGCDVHVVDLRGVFLDRPGGPFAGGKVVKRPEYRMLGAIIVTPKAGKYFVKMYGPAATIEANDKPFEAMLKSLSVE